MSAAVEGLVASIRRDGPAVVRLARQVVDAAVEAAGGRGDEAREDGR